jgi:myo-inositol-1(or 4)-monophosphatase
MRSDAYRQERDVAMEAAREAGTIIRGYYKNPGIAMHKGPDNPVTAADHEANRAIRAHIAQAFPRDGWLSEETTDSVDRLHARRVWVVDPLDGTKEFLQRIPEFSVCIALVQDGRPVVAASYNPVADRLYDAVRGEGTRMNGVPVRVSTTAHLPSATVLASRSEDKRGEWEAFKPSVRVILTGSIAFKLSQVAAGEGDATFTLTPKNEWDVCAGTLLVEEAGGRVSDLDGRPVIFNQPSPLRPALVVSNGILHEGLLALIREVTGRIGPSGRRGA